MVIHSLSLCSGVAGIELGLQIALGKEQIRTVCYVEREAAAAATLVARMEDETLDKAPIWDDITTFDGRPWREKVHLVTAGYPCQPFSYAGKGLAKNDPRHLWPHVLRILQECGAPLLFCENVAGHWGRGFEEVVRDIQKVGFCVAAGAFSAEEVGAPHRRERLFFLAANTDSKSLWEQSERSERRRNDIQAGGETKFRGIHTEGPISNTNGKRELRGKRKREVRRGPSNSSKKDITSHSNLSRCKEQRGETPTEEENKAFECSSWWEAEPPVGRLVDGMAGRVDRLRLAGNGVVPLVAAKAFVSLFREINKSLHSSMDRTRDS